MKKLATLLLAAGLVFAAAAPASAGDVILSGQIGMIGSFGSTMNATDGHHYDPFNVSERVRLQFQYVANENLSAFVRLQAGGQGNYWGSGADFLNNNNAFKVHAAYLDWLIPGTKAQVRMGLQPITLPGATFGTPIFDSRAAGVTINVPFNQNIAVTAGWLRNTPDGYALGTRVASSNSFLLIADFNYDGFQVTPWGMFTKNSEKLAGNVKSNWYLGLSGTYSAFAPFTFTADFIYGQSKLNDSMLYGAAPKQKGWYAAAGVAYKTAYGSPFLKGWYASGDKHSSKYMGQNQLPVFSAGDGNFNASQVYFFDSVNYANWGLDTPAGTWGLSLGWDGLSFVKDLTHSARVVYIKGTNNSIFGDVNGSGYMGYMTTKDHVWELDLNSVYTLYKNLAVGLELGYAIEGFKNEDVKNGYRANLSFMYNF